MKTTTPAETVLLHIHIEGLCILITDAVTNGHRTVACSITSARVFNATEEIDGDLVCQIDLR